jgi:hypothetical protein
MGVVVCVGVVANAKKDACRRIASGVFFYFGF